MKRFNFALLTVLSGMAGISYEILYIRYLELFFGNMYGVTAAILTVFLLGLAIGSLCASRLSRYLYLVEGGIGVYALLFQALVTYVTANGGLPEWLNALPFPTIALLLITPAAFIGMSIPLFSGYLKELMPDDHAFARVYMIYNIGAFVSILFVEFVLLQSFSLSISMNVVAMLNIFIGLMLYLFYRDIGERIVVADGSLLDPGILTIEGLALFLGGLLSSMFQLFFLTVAMHLLTPSHKILSGCIAVSLLSVAIGSGLARFGWLNLRRVFTLTPIVIMLNYLALPAMARMHQVLVPPFPDDAAGSFVISLMLGVATLSFFSATVPAFVKEKAGVIKESGSALAVNCLGNAAGYLLYVTVLQEALSLQLFLILTGAVCFFILWLLQKQTIRPFTIAAVGIWLLLIPLVAVSWSDDRVYGARIHDSGQVVKNGEFEIFKKANDSVCLYKPSPEKNLLLLSYSGHDIWKVQDEDNIILPDQTWLGLGPALFCRNLDRALVIGVGTGVSCGVIAAIFKESDHVELNRAFAPYYTKYPSPHLGQLGTEKARLHYTDGRVFTQQSQTTYDLIFNNVSMPMFFGAGKIFTREYMALAKTKLNRGGVFSVWVSGGMGILGQRSILAALQAEFKHCAMFSAYSNTFILAASDEPLQMRDLSSLSLPDVLADRLEKMCHPFAVEAVLPLRTVNLDIFAAWPDNLDWPINTDDLPILLQTLGQQTFNILTTDFPVFKYALGMHPLSKEKLSPKEFWAQLCELFRVNPGLFLLIAGKFSEEQLNGFADFFFQYLEKIRGKEAVIVDFAQVLIKSNHIGEARSALQLLLRSNPLHLPALRLLAALEQATGNIETGADLEKRAFIIEPIWHEPYLKVE